MPKSKFVPTIPDNAREDLEKARYYDGLAAKASAEATAHEEAIAAAEKAADDAARALLEALGGHYERGDHNTARLQLFFHRRARAVDAAAAAPAEFAAYEAADAAHTRALKDHSEAKAAAAYRAEGYRFGAARFREAAAAEALGANAAEIAKAPYWYKVTEARVMAVAEALGLEPIDGREGPCRGHVKKTYDFKPYYVNVCLYDGHAGARYSPREIEISIGISDDGETLDASEVRRHHGDAPTVPEVIRAARLALSARRRADAAHDAHKKTLEEIKEPIWCIPSVARQI